MSNVDMSNVVKNNKIKLIKVNLIEFKLDKEMKILILVKSFFLLEFLLGYVFM